MHNRRALKRRGRALRHFLFFSLAHTNQRLLVLVFAVCPLWAACNWAVSVTNDSPLHSLLPPLITHPHFLTASLTLFVFLSFLSLSLSPLLISISLSKTGSILCSCSNQALPACHKKNPTLFRLFSRQMVTEEYNSSNNALKSQAKQRLKLHLKVEKHPW